MFLNIKLESVLISLDYKVAMATMQGGITLLQLQKKGRGTELVSGLGTNSRLQGRSIDFAALSSDQSALEFTAQLPGLYLQCRAKCNFRFNIGTSDG